MQLYHTFLFFVLMGMTLNFLSGPLKAQTSNTKKLNLSFSEQIPVNYSWNEATQSFQLQMDQNSLSNYQKQLIKDLRIINGKDLVLDFVIPRVKILFNSSDSIQKVFHKRLSRFRTAATFDYKLNLTLQNDDHFKLMSSPEYLEDDFQFSLRQANGKKSLLWEDFIEQSILLPGQYNLVLNADLLGKAPEVCKRKKCPKFRWYKPAIIGLGILTWYVGEKYRESSDKTYLNYKDDILLRMKRDNSTEEKYLKANRKNTKEHWFKAVGIGIASFGVIITLDEKLTLKRKQSDYCLFCIQDKDCGCGNN